MLFLFLHNVFFANKLSAKEETIKKYRWLLTFTIQLVAISSVYIYIAIIDKHGLFKHFISKATNVRFLLKRWCGKSLTS